jgi:hypothetical protein
MIQGSLLVVTDERRQGRDGLTLAFAEAVVVEVGDAATETLADGTFEAVLVDRERLDLAWLDASAAALRRAVAPGGRVLVALGPTSPEPDSGGRVDDLAAASAPAPAVDAFGWRGLTTVNGRPCAVLDPAEGGAGSTSLLLHAADAAGRLAVPAERGGPVITLSDAKIVLDQQVDGQRRSELALLAHLDALARELDRERAGRRAEATLKGTLRRYKLGRAALGVGSRGKNVVRKISGKR